ncbi:hypothetical protein [Methanobrevibacter woesei]|uniref:hypothetical protein n=1 Tax=Methanobrevibacter woesei TaxID=190976 RepID=UPI0024B7EECA|nr:hypothetical protein [Methanobrevibacter woesei]
MCSKCSCSKPLIILATMLLIEFSNSFGSVFFITVLSAFTAAVYCSVVCFYEWSSTILTIRYVEYCLWIIILLS